MKLMLIAHTRLPFLHSSNEEVRMSVVFDKALKSQVPLESRVAPSDAPILLVSGLVLVAVIFGFFALLPIAPGSDFAPPLTLFAP